MDSGIKSPAEKIDLVYKWECIAHTVFIYGITYTFHHNTQLCTAGARRKPCI